MQEYCQYIRNIFHLITPIDMFKLIARFSIPCKIDNLEQAALYQNEIMYYDKHFSKEQLNYSLAVELAKLLYNFEYTVTIGNEFATELLIPTSEFINLVFNTEKINLQHLANHFQVPSHIINIRGKVLNLWK